MKNQFKNLLSLMIFMGVSAIGFSQQNVGIGTLSPNDKAMLDIQSGDKGFLLPRMTSAQRVAIAGLASTEAGLIVYDTNESRFYFWNGSSWNYYPQKPGDDGWMVSGSNVYSITGANVGVGLPNPSAKLHVLGTVRLDGVGSTTANNLVLTVDGSGNVRTRQLLNDAIWNGNIEDDDADSTNECVSNFNFNINTNRLEITDGCGLHLSPVLPFNANDNDDSPTNELQTISSASSPGSVTVTLSQNNSSTNFTINDADANPTNEAQSLSITKTGTTVNWALSNVSGVGGGSGNFTIDPSGWTGSGTGKMYASDSTDDVGIGNTNPAHKLHVTGNILTSDKLYAKSTSYYVTSVDTSLQLFSNTNIKLQTNRQHLTTYDHTGSEALINHSLNGQNVMTLRGNGSYPYSVGIGTTQPANKLHVAGDARIGLISPSSSNTNPSFGNLLYFSGGLGFSGFNSDNDDLLYMARYNSGADETELRIGVGDDANQSSGTDRLSIGAYTGGDYANYTGLFEFDIENIGTTAGPMLSISPNTTAHTKGYHGGLAITKPVGLNGQYINLARGNLTVWSIGYQYGTNRFAIHEGNTTDGAFATTPHFTIIPGGNVGLGVSSPVYQLELSANSAAKPGSDVWTILSDMRLKKDIKPFTDGLDVVKQINPITFHYNGVAGLPENEEFVGIIAQDIQKIAPYMIGEWKHENKDGELENFLSYDSHAMTYILVNAIKEQQKQIEQLQDQNAAMQREISGLRTGMPSAEK